MWTRTSSFVNLDLESPQTGKSENYLKVDNNHHDEANKISEASSVEDLVIVQTFVGEGRSDVA
jgi:hypothetical protein